MGPTTTPSGAELVARLASGTEENITEAVQALYDLVIQSLDWASGFLTVEDAEPMARLAELCGFEQRDEVQRYIEEHRAIEAREKELRSKRLGPRLDLTVE